MQEPILRNMDEALQNLANNGKGFIFWQFFPLFEQILKIALVAELRDDVAIVGSTEDIVAFQHVVVV